MNKKLNISAPALLSLLAQRHSTDVFIPECKDGPSQGSSHFRMDAWAMLKSWSNPLTFAYEIKVSRSDFTRDDKWHAYLPYCSEFYFVCPPGLIRPDELPPEAGLMYCSATASKLFIKKRGLRRTVEIPECVYRYILMCRARITRSWNNYEEAEPRERWKAWLAQKHEDRELGVLAGRAIGETIKARITDVETQNRHLKFEMENYDEVKEVLTRLGFTPDKARGWQVQDRIEEIRRVVPKDLDVAITRAIGHLEEMQSQLKALSEKVMPDGSAEVMT